VNPTKLYLDKAPGSLHGVHTGSICPLSQNRQCLPRLLYLNRSTEQSMDDYAAAFEHPAKLRPEMLGANTHEGALIGGPSIFLHRCALHIGEIGYVLLRTWSVQHCGFVSALIDYLPFARMIELRDKHYRK